MVDQEDTGPDELLCWLFGHEHVEHPLMVPAVGHVHGPDGGTVGAPAMVNGRGKSQLGGDLREWADLERLDARKHRSEEGVSTREVLIPLAVRGRPGHGLLVLVFVLNLEAVNLGWVVVP
jgi:hypothetical protein